jgi:hypothetical protein
MMLTDPLTLAALGAFIVLGVYCLVKINRDFPPWGT